MRCGGEAEDEHSRVRVAEPRNWLAPVFLVAISRALRLGHALAIGAESRAALAGDDRRGDGRQVVVVLT
jgi:hypothetical protein